MILIKGFILVLIFISTAFLGILVSNKYKNRVRDLKELRSILNILETKINYTYEPLPQIFLEISRSFKGEISKIFKFARDNMEEMSAGEAFEYAVKEAKTNLNNEDTSIILGLSKLLGKTNVEGQLSEIALNKKLIDVQIKKAEEEQAKN